MDLRVLPLTQRELPLCEHLWPDRPGFTDREFAEVLDTLERLLSERRVLGRVVMQDERLVAYGISAFVHDEFAGEYLANPHPQMGKRLLLETPTCTILASNEIAESNAGEGLHLVVLSANHDTTSSDPISALAQLMSAAVEGHRGYRVQRIIQEPIGEPAVTVVVTQGDWEILGVFESIAPGIPIPSVAATMDRARAAARKTPFLPMFLYTPPQVLFTPAEKELLRAALNGAPDEVISERLGIPVSAVKGRWHRIHQRAADRIPELFQQTPALVGDGYRGRQIRHVILEYVRDNPSELTPYARLPRFRPQRRG